MAVCPFWTKTEFFDRAVASDESRSSRNTLPCISPGDRRAGLEGREEGKDMSKCGFKARMQALGVKILPHSIVMDTWLRQQELE